MWDWVGKAADIASLASLLVSGYAAWQITAVRRKVSRQILFNVQAPELVTLVVETANWLSGNYAGGAAVEQELLVKVGICLGRIAHHEAELSGDIRKRLKLLNSMFGEYKCPKRWVIHKTQSETASDRRLRVMGDMITEFQVLAGVLPDMIEARSIGGSDDA